MLSTISNTLYASVNTAAPKDAPVGQDQGSKPATVPGVDSVSDSTVVKISVAAQQKAKADAEKAAQAKMSPQELKAEAKKLLAPLVGLTSDAAVARAAQEVPDTEDPVLLARAKQATAFYSNHHLPNPFAGLPRDKLTDIIYDNSGAYTTNERCAAMSEQEDQDFNYWSRVFALDALSGGDHQDLYKALVDDYEKLSPIERAADNYPPTYLADLKRFFGPDEKVKKHHGIAHSLLAPSPPLLKTTESLAISSMVLNSSGSNENVITGDSTVSDPTDSNAVDPILLKIMNGKLNRTT